MAAKFSGTKTPTRTTSPIATTSPAKTHEGGLGYERDPKSALFLLAVTNMVAEQTFYESGAGRDNRFKSLVHQVTSEDPDWVARFVPYLRDTMNMRSASVVMAAEYVRAGGPHGRRVVTSALSRADEPAEILAYWVQSYGKKIPQALKRGVADAVLKLYNEKSALKYDGQSRAWRMGDVIELVHPKPRAEWQSVLFKYLLDHRHRDDAVVDGRLPKIYARYELEALPVESRRAFLDNPQVLAEAGMTWESLSGWLQGPMDARAWEAIIPSMGYMALLRNLRNFDEAKISEQTAQRVVSKLINPEEVARSRQFPYRFWSAYKNAPSMRWGHALEYALDLSTANIPELSGKTLILVDLSGSMTARVSDRSQIARYEIGALFGMAVLKKTRSADLVGFGTHNQNLRLSPSTSVLRGIEEFRRLQESNRLEHGTYGETAIRDHYTDHHRIVIFTDGQWHDSGGYGGFYRSRRTEAEVNDALPNVPIYTFDLAGYGTAPMESGRNNRHTFGGFTDAGFRMLKLLEDHQSGDWPF